MSVAQQINDLREEGQELHKTLLTISDDQWNRPTPFKDRTVNWVVQHLHDADRWAYHSITDPDGFRAWVKNRNRVAEEQEKLTGPELRERWIEYLDELCNQLTKVNPDLRAPWFGPDMGIRMMATARQMETWSHGQDIYDLFEVPRQNSDRIKNICHIGVRTYGWTFVNRQLEIPHPTPFVHLTSPSGNTWTWGEASADEFVKGDAVEFAHVVTQGRNIQDVSLEVKGKNASSWMAIAQCFAGPPETPPEPGHRAWKYY